MDSAIMQNVPYGLILPTLNLLEKGIYSISRKKRFYSKSYQYDKFLTNQVFNSKNNQTYYASIGEGDWVSSWISRLNDFKLRVNQKSLKIDRIVIKHLNSNLAKNLEEQKILSPNFSQRMLNNIEIIKNSAASWDTKVDIVIREWNIGIPTFHGHSIGDWTLIGSWAVNQNGFLHVKTPLNVYHKSVDERYYNWIIKSFE